MKEGQTDIWTVCCVLYNARVVCCMLFMLYALYAVCCMYAGKNNGLWRGFKFKGMIY